MNELLVQFHADTPGTQRHALVESLGYHVVEEIAPQQILVIRCPPHVTIPQAIAQWRERPEVRHAEPNAEVSLE